MAQDEIERLYSMGMIGPQEYRRLKARGARRRFNEELARAYDGVDPPGPVSSRQLNDARYQASGEAWRSSGQDREDFGPQDAGQLDARANRRPAPKETLIRGQPQRDRRWPTVAEAQKISHYRYQPEWYGENT
jgi:hypothetical protein